MEEEQPPMDPLVVRVQTNYLKDKLDMIGSSGADLPLVASLKEILRHRNREVALGEEEESLYRTAVACVARVNKHHPRLMGSRSDGDSLSAIVSKFVTTHATTGGSNNNISGRCAVGDNKKDNDNDEEEEDSESLERLAAEVAEMANATADYIEKRGACPRPLSTLGNEKQTITVREEDDSQRFPTPIKEGRMKIYVQVPSGGKKHPANFKPETTILGVKEALYLYFAKAVPVDCMQLIHSGKELENDDRTLESYNITEGTTIHMGGAANKRGSTKVFVRMLTTSRKKAFRFEPEEDTVSVVKQALWETTGIPVDDIGLIHEGKQLANEKTLGNYDIGEGATIHFVMHL